MTDHRGSAATKVKVEFTTAGPKLWIGKVLVRCWLGTAHDEDAVMLARQIAEALK